MPGTTQLAPNGLGIIYQGQDGLPHGTVLDPSTGDFHTFSNKNSSGAGNGFKGFLEESGSAKSPHAATPNKTASGPQTNQWKSPRVQNWGGTKSNPQTLNRNLQGYRSTYRSR